MPNKIRRIYRTFFMKNIARDIGNDNKYSNNQHPMATLFSLKYRAIIAPAISQNRIEMNIPNHSFSLKEADVIIARNDSTM